MATVAITQQPSSLARTRRLVGLLGIMVAHVLAFASLFFQVLWIVPVYQSAFDNAPRAIPAMTTQAIQFASYFTSFTVQWSYIGVLVANLVLLFVLFRRSSATSNSVYIYSHFVLVGLISFLVWNSLALCIGLPSL